MDFSRLDLGTFETEEQHTGKKRTDPFKYAFKRRRFSKKRRAAWKREENYGYSMLAKLGICAVSAALVLIGNTYSSKGVETLPASAAPGAEQEEELGRLRFVELPGLLSVFSGDGKYELPAACDTVSVLEDKTLLCLSSSLAQSVEAPDAGKIKTVGLDKDYGTYVSILTENDREIQLYGFLNVSVEEGQSVLRGDTLGYTEAGSELYVKLYEIGKLAEVDAYFRMEVLS